MRHVLDASAAIRIVLGDMGGVQPNDFVTALRSSILVLAPSLFHSEVANTLWKYVRAGQLDAVAARSRYRDAVDLVDHFEPDAVLADEALAEASTYQHPVYDMLYLVLARRHDAELLTADQRLAATWPSLARSRRPDL